MNRKSVCLSLVLPFRLENRPESVHHCCDNRFGSGAPGKEIGIRKATGATSRTIKNQFLAEAIVIAQIGGFLGIIFGIGIGNILSFIIGSSFIIPWIWIIVGVVLCFIVAIASGYLPATKAAKLDPIESLRYE